MAPVSAYGAAVDDLELEPTHGVGDDQGAGCRESAELAGPTAEEALQAALGV
jgi:hypothetical protein